MTEKELRSLKKTDFLKIIQEQELEIEQLTSDNGRLKQQLAERVISLEKAGSIADASLQVTEIFKAAQESADIYLENIRDMENRVKADAGWIEKVAREKADAMVKEAEEKCTEREQQERQRVESMWQELQDRLMQLLRSYSDLGELVRKINIFSIPAGEQTDRVEIKIEMDEAENGVPAETKSY